jgi:hypothetical protein
MLSRGEGQRALFGSCPIDHADVLVGVRDPMDIQKAGGNQGTCSGGSGGGPFANQFNFEAAFFLGFAEGGLFGIFVEFDMSAEWEPFIEFAMVDEQNFVVANDEDCDCEIDLFVNVRHGN